MQLIPAHTPELIAAARELIREYGYWTGLDLGFQDFEPELASLPGKYAPPEGCLILARSENEYAGCVALRKFSDGVCEMKRLYVRQSFQRQGLGKALAVEIIAKAQRIGYREMLLDTVASMKPAIALYESLGFIPTHAYYHNPHPEARYFKLNLL